MAGSSRDSAAANRAHGDRSYYAEQSASTDPGEMAWLLADLPADIPTLQQIANGMVIHFRMDDPLKIGLSPERISREIDARWADTMLALLLELDQRPLGERRPASSRVAGCCRDFTVFFLAMARALGIPARGRVGFAKYFFEGANSDHEIAEAWDEAEGRWRLVDPQLKLDHVDPNDGAALDPADLPRDRYLVAGEAWQQCRRGEADPATFMVRPDIELEITRGMGYITHNLVLDLAALNKAEMLLWDMWGLGGQGLAFDTLSEEDVELLDRVAALTAQPEPPLSELISLYSSEPSLRVPETVTSFHPITFAPREVTMR